MQKFNAQYAEMRLLAYRILPLSVPCVFSKFEMRERLGLKIGGGGRVPLRPIGNFNHWERLKKVAEEERKKNWWDYVRKDMKSLCLSNEGAQEKDK